MKNSAKSPFTESSATQRIPETASPVLADITGLMHDSGDTGLSGLQQATRNVISGAAQWGFSNSKLKIKRHKLDQDTWQLTVVNPRTQKTILQAEGHGDTVFAHEDNLARMAETLMAQGLTIRTQFND